MSTPPPPDAGAAASRFRRWRRVCGLTGLAAVLVVAVFYLIEDWRGARAWSLAQDRLATEGEAADLESLRPTPVPTGQNFCATPALDGVNAEDERADQVRRRLYRLEIQPDAGPTPRQFLRRGPPDWAAWRRQLEHTRHLKPDPAEADPARSLVLGFAPHEALFDELIEAAATRPRAAFQPPLYRPFTRSPMTVCFFGFGQSEPFDALCDALELRARLALAVGEARRASELLTVLWRCREAVAADPSPVGQGMAGKIEDRARRVLLDGLARRVWNEDTLRAWQDALDAVDYRPRLLAAARWELADTIGFLDRMQADRRAGTREWYGVHWEIGESAFSPQNWAFRLAPRGWLRQHQAAATHHFLDHRIIPLRDHGLLAWYGEESARHAARQAAPPPDHREIIARVRSKYLLWSILYPSPATARAWLFRQVESRQLSLACALERHYLRHQRYPESLSELAPDQRTAIPPDLDGQPLRYAPDRATGRYRLWSVGADLVDDWHGQPPPPTDTRRRPEEAEALDWVLVPPGSPS